MRPPIPNYRPASWKGLPFHIESIAMTFGRQTVMHQYPYRLDSGEDLGPNSRTYQIEAYFIGPSYEADRDAFIRSAENDPGPGLLIHPFYGERTCRLQPGCQLTVTRTERNYETISFTLVEEAPTRATAPIPDTAATVASAADAVNLALGEDIPLRLLVAGPSTIANTATQVATVQTNLLAQLVAEAGAAATPLTQWTRQLTTYRGNLVSLLANPVGYVASQLTLLAGLSPLMTTATRAYGLYQQLFRLLDTPIWPDNTADQTPARIQTNRNTATQHTLTRIATLTLLAQTTTALPYTSRDAVQATRDQLSQQMRDELKLLGNTNLDTTAQALRSLQAATVAELTRRAGSLARVETVTLNVPTPALVLAYDRLGDPAREAEIVAENHIPRPGFVPAGQPLKLLTR